MSGKEQNVDLKVELMIVQVWLKKRQLQLKLPLCFKSFGVFFRWVSILTQDFFCFKYGDLKFCFTCVKYKEMPPQLKKNLTKEAHGDGRVQHTHPEAQI